MKSARIDQILLRLGYVTEDEVRQALDRQKDKGGRLGAHLVHYGFVTEHEIARALSAQFELACFVPEQHKVDPELARRLPEKNARDWEVLPFRYENRGEILYMAVADPLNQAAIEAVQRGFRAARVEVFVCPEVVLDRLFDECYRQDLDPVKRVELPELFQSDARNEEAPLSAFADDPSERGNVLVVAAGASLRHFLQPIFQREGYEVEVTSDLTEIRSVMKSMEFEHILVAQDLFDQFQEWRREKEIPLSTAQISVFTSVSESLLENPAQYNRMMRSLFRSVEIIAEMRCGENGWMPPYEPMMQDIRSLGSRFGMRRIAVDGTELAAQLLLPNDKAMGITAGDGVSPFAQYGATVSYARTIHFPWPVDAVIQKANKLYAGEVVPGEGDSLVDEVDLAAQILAVIWHRHIGLLGIAGPEEDVAMVMKSKLREQAGILATLEVIELYIRALEEEDKPIDPGTYHQILIVSKTDELSRQFATRFSRAGCRTAWTDDLAEAQRMCDRHSPTAVVVDYASFKGATGKFSRLMKLIPEVLLYAVTPSKDPAIALDLLDAGVDDVLEPPHDYDIIAARISRAIRGLSQGQVKRKSGFSASLEVFSFIELIQTLGQSQKSVRIELERGNGDTAVVHMHDGAVIHAQCLEATGAEAVYRVISWEEDGTFSVVPTSQFPPANVRESNEGLLMEGCRLLDESKV